MMQPAADTLTDVVARAVRAPSLHNTQPWRFRILLPDAGPEAGMGGAVLEVRSDPSRALPVADPTGWGVRIACGAAVFGLRLGIATHGHRPETTVLPDPADPALIARVRVGARHPAAPWERELYAAIPRRRSNRYPFSDVPAAPDSADRLISAALAEEAWLDVVEDASQRTEVASLMHEGQDRLKANPAYREEFAGWLREVDGVDGIPREAGGLHPLPYDLLAFRDFSDRPRAPGRDFEPHPLICVLGTHHDHPAAQIRAGMALHRVLLAGTAAGLASSMLSQAIEVPDLRLKLRVALGHSTGWPQIVLRFGYGVRTPLSPRRPVSDVVDITALRI